MVRTGAGDLKESFAHHFVSNRVGPQKTEKQASRVREMFFFRVHCVAVDGRNSASKKEYTLVVK